MVTVATAAVAAPPELAPPATVVQAVPHGCSAMGATAVLVVQAAATVATAALAADFGEMAARAATVVWGALDYLDRLAPMALTLTPVAAAVPVAWAATVIPDRSVATAGPAGTSAESICLAMEALAAMAGPAGTAEPPATAETAVMAARRRAPRADLRAFPVPVAPVGKPVRAVAGEFSDGVAPTA